MKVWALWRDRRLTRSELRHLEPYAPGRSVVHACVAAIWDEADTATHLAHVTYQQALADAGWEVGECEGDVWAPELLILERAREGFYAGVARAALVTELDAHEQHARHVVADHHEREHIRAELLTHAGWCRWCAHHAFFELGRAGR